MVEIREMQKRSVELLNKINQKLNVQHNPNGIFLHLAEEVGEVARELSKKEKNWREDFDNEKLADELVDVIGQVLIIAEDNNIDIETAYINKIKKICKRFELD